jgi:hypothetical protein
MGFLSRRHKEGILSGKSFPHMVSSQGAESESLLGWRGEEFEVVSPKRSDFDRDTLSEPVWMLGSPCLWQSRLGFGSPIGCAGGTAPEGNIWVMISGHGGRRAHFDNIRLDGTVIPEPTVEWLAGLMLLRRRR